MHQHIKTKRPPKMKPKTYGGYTIQAPKTFCQWKTSMHVGEIKQWYHLAVNRYYYIVISNAAEQWRVIITRMIKHMIKYVLMTNRTADMDPVINMNGVSWNIKTWYWVLKHMAMICQDLPVRLPNTITGLKIMDGSKIEWSVDEHILVKHMNVLRGNYQVILNSIRSRWARRLDQMTLMRLIWMQ